MSTQTMDLDEVKTVIHEILVSHPEKCMTVATLYHEYKRCVGDEWPFREFHFHSSYEFLLSMSDTLEVGLP